MNYIDFQYTGAVQEFIVPNTGIYTLECWGLKEAHIQLLT